MHDLYTIEQRVAFGLLSFSVLSSLIWKKIIIAYEKTGVGTGNFLEPRHRRVPMKL